MPYLTGDDPAASVVKYSLLVPDDALFRYAVRGALLELTREYNWEQTAVGELTPEQSVALAVAMYSTFQPDEGGTGGSAMMIGAIVFMLQESVIPDGLLRCDGQTFLREDYPDLYQHYVDISTPLIIDADSAITPDLVNGEVGYTGVGDITTYYCIVAR